MLPIFQPMPVLSISGGWTYRGLTHNLQLYRTSPECLVLEACRAARTKELRWSKRLIPFSVHHHT